MYIHGMINAFLMKKLVVFLLLFVCLTGHSENLPDTVAMTVAGKNIPLSEFIFIAEKNGEVDLSDRKAVKEYVELFKNFKLKVAEAESLGLDKTPAFRKELDGYKAQLMSGYLSDKAAEEAAAREVYDRGNEVVELSHILLRLPEKTLLKDTLAVYREAMDLYGRLEAGEDLDSIGTKLEGGENTPVVYEHVRCLMPMQSVKAFENAAYTLPVGQISKPVRTTLGYHLIKVYNRRPNPGKIVVSHILIAFPKDSAGEDKAGIRARAEEVYRKVQAGEDFAQLAKTYSADVATAKEGGVLPPFGLGQMVRPFEEAAFALQTPGEVSGLVESRFGFHIIKLIERQPRPSFDKEKQMLVKQMEQGERNFELFQAFDERMKKEYGYVFYPEAYAELLALCEEHFPSDPQFYEKAKEMKKTLAHLGDMDFPQDEFAYYLQRCPFSTKSYAGDFMQEVYDLFIRNITNVMEKKNLAVKHPEYTHLMQEYRDGILLFEISNREVWTKPAAQQKVLEKIWIKNLNRKYPVEVNWKLLKKLEK